MTCSICWDDMDMKDFKDLRECTLTCYKLECGHAFHTKCIITSLSKTKHQCPLCNKEKTLQDKIQEQGYIKKLLRIIGKIPKIKEIKNEIVLAKNDYKHSLSILKKDIIEYANNRSKELKIQEQRNYFLNCLSEGRQILRQECYERGNNHAGLILFYKERYWSPSIGDKYLCPESARYWSFNKLRNPRIFFKIKINKLNKTDKIDESSNSNCNGDDNSSICSFI